MKLYQLIMLLDADTEFAISYGREIVKYTNRDELYEDFVFFEEVKDKEVYNIWNSKNLYGCIVIGIA